MYPLCYTPPVTCVAFSNQPVFRLRCLSMTYVLLMHFHSVAPLITAHLHVHFGFCSSPTGHFLVSRSPGSEPPSPVADAESRSHTVPAQPRTQSYHRHRLEPDTRRLKKLSVLDSKVYAFFRWIGSCSVWCEPAKTRVHCFADGLDVVNAIKGYRSLLFAVVL